MIESPLLGLLLLGALLAAPVLLRRARAASPDGVRVVGRTALHKGAVVAVVAVGERRLLLGAGERGVQLLAEMEPVTEAPTERGVGSPDAGRMDAARHTTSTHLDSPAALDALLGGHGSSPLGDEDWSGGFTAGPGNGLVDRLRAMTVRTAPAAARPGTREVLHQVVRGGAGRPIRAALRR